ncbi:MAG: twin-arginine translocase TatA/TatE family subunit [Proteobacteria bacterium]|nr:MAG: twin-arginine translocase TatA/TatE family subunit [Pseudomonadota bacterium]
MFGELGVPELLLILGVALLIFGPKKIGELGKGLGEGIRGFKSAVRGDEDKKPVAPAEPVATEEAPKPTTTTTAS